MLSSSSFFVTRRSGAVNQGQQEVERTPADGCGRSIDEQASFVGLDLEAVEPNRVGEYGSIVRRGCAA